jgi:hypothetical protein
MIMIIICDFNIILRSDDNQFKTDYSPLNQR